MIKLTNEEGGPVWIAPDKIVAVVATAGPTHVWTACCREEPFMVAEAAETVVSAARLWKERGHDD